jgi:hypothetical protein
MRRRIRWGVGDRKVMAVWFGRLHVPNLGLRTKLTAHWHIRKTDVKKGENDDKETEDKQNKTLPERKDIDSL